MANKKVIYTTKWITCTAMMVALVAVTGIIPPIPLPGGNVYWVDGMVLIAAFLLDPLAAFCAGGMGTFIYDIFKAPDMMLTSLLTHGLQGAVVSAILRYVLPKLFKEHEVVRAIIASLAGAVVVVSGYFIYRVFVRGLPSAIASIPRNVIQEAIGISVAIVICYLTTFKKQVTKAHLLPEIKALKN